MGSPSFIRLLPYLRARWRGLAVLVAVSVLASVVAALTPWPLKILVDFALSSGTASDPVQRWAEGFQPTTLVVTAGIAALVVALARAGVTAAAARAWAAVGHRMVYDLAASLFDTYQRLSLAGHARRPVGDALARLTSDTYSVYTVTSELLVSPVQQVLSLVLVGAVAWALDPVLTLVCLATAPLLAVSARFFGTRIKKRSKVDREAQSEVTSHVHRTLSSIEIVQAFGQEEGSRRRFDRLADQAVSASQRRILFRDSFQFAHEAIVATGNAMVIGVGGLRILSGDMTVGALLVFMTYLRTMQGGIRGLLGIYANLKSAEASVERVVEILDSEDQVGEAPDARPLPISGRPHRSVEFRDVVFGYDPGRPVLRGVSLEIPAGQRIAVVGTTGSGKTTLASLIPRFFDPWSGEVRIDGRDIRTATLDSVRAQVALVLQDAFILPLSLADNIAVGRHGATRQEIEAAAERALATTFIGSLPQGFDTVVGERGTTLSGGERQRIALARAFLSGAPILILDEPTSALDTGTESALFEALDRQESPPTTLIIAHRLSTVRQADRIVVLSEGRLAEQGTHDELLRRGGVYAGLWALQDAVGTEARAS